MFKKIFITVFLMSWSNNIFAAQIIEVFDNVEVVVKVSRKDINRLNLVNDEVVEVHANKGDFTYSKSENTGDLYFSLVNKWKSSINLFLETKKGYRYKLLLKPSNIPSEQIIAQNPEIINNDKVIKNDDYKARIANILKVAIPNYIPTGYRVVKSSKNLKFNGDLALKQIHSFIPATGNKDKDKFLITKYKLTNKSDNDVEIQEAQFLRKGVLAISIGSKKIAPNEFTYVTIVKGA